MKLRKPNTKRENTKAADESAQDGLKELEKPRKKHTMRYVLLYLAAIGFVFYAVITIINQSVKIAEKKAELSELQQHINVVEIESKYLDKVYNLTGKERDEYMEKRAKEDLGYVGEGERYFINE